LSRSSESFPAVPDDRVAHDCEVALAGNADLARRLPGTPRTVNGLIRFPACSSASMIAPQPRVRRVGG
jgi:hypothetical protein